MRRFFLPSMLMQEKIFLILSLPKGLGMRRFFLPSMLMQEKIFLILSLPKDERRLCRSE